MPRSAGAEPPIAGARWWEFRGRIDRPDPSEVAPLLGRLRSALRVGHGLGVVFALRWEGGRSARILAGAKGAAAQRWVRELLAPSFHAGPWAESTEPAEPPPPRVVRFVVPRVGLALPPPGAPEEPSWGEVLAAGLPHLPPDVVVLLDFRPARDPHPRPPRTLPRASELERVPAGYRPRPVSGPERREADDRFERGGELLWAVRGTVAVPDGPPSVGLAIERVGGVLGRAAHRHGSGGLTLVRPWPILRASAPWFLASEREVLGAFPSPWTPLRRAAAPTGPGAVPLWIGAEGRLGATALPVDPTNGRHLLILGETGMGKSSLLVRLAIQAARSASVVLLDPIGDTGVRLLDSLPPADLGRVTWVSPSRSPVGVNAIHRPPDPRGADPHDDRSVGDLVNALRRVRAQRYGEAPFWGPRIEEAVTMALRAASAYPGGTIDTAERLLARADHPNASVPVAVRSIVADLKERVLHRPEEVEGARRLLAEISQRPTLRRMLCAPRPRWSMAEAIRPGRLTVVTGDAPVVGESNARYLLAVDLALLWSAIVGRVGRGKVFVLLDEAHWFAHESAAEMLRMGRRYNLHLVLATQALGALVEPVREAALTNSADLVLFRGAPAEAREIARWVPSVAPERLLTLPIGHAVVLTDKGRTVDWAIVPPLPPVRPDRSSCAEAAERSLSRFGSPEEGAADDGDAATVSPPAEAGPVPPCGPDPTRALRLLAAAIASASPIDGPVRVPLAFLRESADPEGATVRQLGRDLQAGGGLLRTDRNSGASVWLLKRSCGLFDRLFPPPAAEELEWAAARWRAWSEEVGSGRRQEF